LDRTDVSEERIASIFRAGEPRLHGTKSQKTTFFIVIAVKTSNLTFTFSVRKSWELKYAMKHANKFYFCYKRGITATKQSIQYFCYKRGITATKQSIQYFCYKRGITATKQSIQYFLH
jgi:hypothetical protein